MLIPLLLAAAIAPDASPQPLATAQGALFSNRPAPAKGAKSD